MAELPGMDEIHKAATADDFTSSGIFFVVTLAFGIVIIFLFKRLEKAYSDRADDQKEHSKKLEEFSQLIVKINGQYYDTIKNLGDIFGKNR